MFFELIINIGEKIPFADLPTGLAHCDIFLDNMIKNTSSKIYLLDFEEVAIENYLFDVGRSIIGCCIHNDLVDLNLARRLIEGYETVRKLSSLEIDYLVDYIIYCGGISAFWRYYEFNVKRPDEEKKDFYKKILTPVKALIDNKDHVKSLLIS
ncbi:MAG: hypothetical protein D3906_16975 [Candidatus Electrothrix sp. AUS1_2]|nr:hypothetical protein [Candidatus Electrothrix sp. AUS1_2]